MASCAGVLKARFTTLTHAASVLLRAARLLLLLRCCYCEGRAKVLVEVMRFLC